jgi:site-specific DNA recombinase
VQLLELAKTAQKLFEQQPPREKRRLLNFLLSNCTWRDGQIGVKFRQPFDLLAETNAAAKDFGTGNRADLAESEIWLGN